MLMTMMIMIHIIIYKLHNADNQDECQYSIPDFLSLWTYRTSSSTLVFSPGPPPSDWHRSSSGALIDSHLGFNFQLFSYLLASLFWYAGNCLPHIFLTQKKYKTYTEQIQNICTFYNCQTQCQTQIKTMKILIEYIKW